MKYITIQLQPDLEPTARKDQALSILTSEGFCPEIDEGEDQGRFVNFNISVEDLKVAWLKIKSTLLKETRFLRSTIVTCEGSNGWDDYLLLHHFDGSEALDKL